MERDAEDSFLGNIANTRKNIAKCEVICRQINSHAEEILNISQRSADMMAKIKNIQKSRRAG